jgi:hypothetical protein
VLVLALFPYLSRVNKLWAIIASILHFLGLVLFIITSGIGRSGILASGLLSAVLMRQSDRFSKGIAYSGILANALLLIGDVGIGFSRSGILAVIMGCGYVLIWFGAA